MRRVSFLLALVLLIVLPAAMAAPARSGYQDDESRQPEVDIILYFEATADADSVLLEWETGYEPTDLQGFYIRRTTDPAALPEEAERISGLLMAAGDPSGALYDYTDESVSSEGVTYYYWLEVVADAPDPPFEGPAEATVGEPVVRNYLPLFLGP